MADGRNGLAGIFRRKSKGPAHGSLFEAQDADDALAAAFGGPAEPPASPGSRPGRPWGVLSRKDSGTGGGAAPAAAAAAASAAGAEAQQLRGECARQGAELQQLRGEAAAAQAAAQRAQELLNLQRFKYELLIDLWAMRVLDNEEMAATN